MRKDISEIIAKFFWETGSIKVSVDPPFEMTSGKLSPFYIDCRILISYPFERDVITDYAHWIYEENQLASDCIAGGETAGIPFAAWLAERMKKPYIYVRKKPKGHGLTSQIEGHVEKNSTILLYEDLITDGKSKLNFLTGIKNAGCRVEDCLVIFDRQEGGAEALKQEGVRLLSLIDMDDCLEVGLKNNFITSKEMDIISEYRQSLDS
jgi:orotate phosphoribosyltransferase